MGNIYNHVKDVVIRKHCLAWLLALIAQFSFIQEITQTETNRMEASLHGQFGRINLGATKLTIGRAPNNQLVLNHSQVSGYHAEIRPDGQGYSIIDFGSTNGTFVNEYRLTPNVPRSLNPNDRLRFGQQTNKPGTTFTFEVQGVAPVEPTDSKLPPLSANSSSSQQA